MRISMQSIAITKNNNTLNFQSKEPSFYVSSQANENKQKIKPHRIFFSDLVSGHLSTIFCGFTLQISTIFWYWIFESVSNYSPFAQFYLRFVVVVAVLYILDVCSFCNLLVLSFYLKWEDFFSNSYTVFSELPSQFVSPFFSTKNFQWISWVTSTFGVAGKKTITKSSVCIKRMHFGRRERSESRSKQPRALFMRSSVIFVANTSISSKQFMATRSSSLSLSLSLSYVRVSE